MKTVKRVVYVERGKGKGNFSCFAPEPVGTFGLAGYGKTAREAMADIKVSLQEYKEMEAEEGREVPDVEFDFRLDVGSFFDYYPIDVTAFAKYIGMNASVLRQYIASLREPREPQMIKIREGIKLFANDLAHGLPLEQPVV
jgi:predicted RNase H-like HicB family nuclease